MGILLWIIFGAIAGWITSMLMNTGRSSVLWDIILGVIGSVVGGFVMNLLGQPGVNGFNMYSFIVAIIGAAIVIYIGRMLRRSGSII